MPFLQSQHHPALSELSTKQQKPIEEGLSSAEEAKFWRPELVFCLTACASTSKLPRASPTCQMSVRLSSESKGQVLGKQQDNNQLPCHPSVAHECSPPEDEAKFAGKHEWESTQESMSVGLKKIRAHSL